MIIGSNDKVYSITTGARINLWKRIKQLEARIKELEAQQPSLAAQEMPDATPLDGDAYERIYNEAIGRAQRENPLLRAVPTPARGKTPHPEDFCHRCYRPNVTWFAPSEIWNKSVRSIGAEEILCPVCFVQLAEQAGFNTEAWKLEPEGFVPSCT